MAGGRARANLTIQPRGRHRRGPLGGSSSAYTQDSGFINLESGFFSQDHHRALRRHHPDECTVVRNTTEALNAVIHGIPLEAGDEILYCSREYPSMQVLRDP